MDKKNQTVDTYNRSAKALAHKFDMSGARTTDILEVFDLVQKENPYVLEIGCGNGRDAVEILKHTTNYIGIDISEELIKLAREKNPTAHFEVADTALYQFPQDLDIVFAFASLIHVAKDECKDILLRLSSALNVGGIVRLSLKYSPKYKETVEESEFGTRAYYYYSTEDIREMAQGFTIITSVLVEKRSTTWLETILQKQ